MKGPRPALPAEDALRPPSPAPSFVRTLIIKLTPMHTPFLPLRRATAWPHRFGSLLTALSLTALSGGLAQTPSLVANHTTYYAGEDVVFTFADGPGNRLNWIGIYPEGVVPGSVASTRWFYVDGTQQGNSGLREGTVTFAGGLNLAGPWTAHLLENDGYTSLASITFNVIDPGWPLVRTDKRSYVTGEPIAVTFQNGAGNRLDWIGIYQEGQTPGGGPSSTLWSYVDGTQVGTTALTDGTVTFSGGLAAAGNFVVFFLLNDGYDVLASEPFTVTPPAATTPRVVSVTPGPNAVNQPPNAGYAATIRNGSTQMVPASVVLTVDGGVVTHQLTQEDDIVTVAYTPTALWPSGSTHTFRLEFADNATPANAFANEVTFSVGTYRNIVLPAPLYFEDFDGTAEGALPAGWTSVSYTEVLNSELDLGNLDSASYADWIVVAADRFTGSFVTYSNPDNPAGWGTDYQRVLTVNPLNVLNGQVYDRPLASGRFAFGNSGYRNGRSQVLYLFSPDFNLAGRTDVHLAFHSLWEQNQDSMAAIEYSVDRGTTWLPLAYFLDGPDIVTVTDETTGEVTVDAVATLTAEHGDVARYVDPETFEEKGGHYGAFLGAEISPALAPFIQARVNDNAAESKRIELYRLTAADNQAAVRFRFAHAGTDSWYFGIDNFGLYSIPATPVEPPTLTWVRSGEALTLSWPASATGFVLESSPAVAPASWSAVSGVSGNSVTVTMSAAAGFYRLRAP